MALRSDIRVVPFPPVRDYTGSSFRSITNVDYKANLGDKILERTIFCTKVSNSNPHDRFGISTIKSLIRTFQGGLNLRDS